jgi:DNA-binding GntR family transcriptional regulator
MTKSVEERLGLNVDETVYRLTYADAICILEDALEEEMLNNISDNDLHQALSSIIKGFSLMDWNEWGTEGLNIHLLERREDSHVK